MREAAPQRVMTGDGMLSFHPYFDVLQNWDDEDRVTWSCQCVLQWLVSEDIH